MTAHLRTLAIALMAVGFLMMLLGMTLLTLVERALNHVDAD